MFLSYLSSKSTQKIIIFVGINFARLFIKLGLSALISSYSFRYLNASCGKAQMGGKAQNRTKARCHRERQEHVKHFHLV